MIDKTRIKRRKLEREESQLLANKLGHYIYTTPNPDVSIIREKWLEIEAIIGSKVLKADFDISNLEFKLSRNIPQITIIRDILFAEGTHENLD